jgi:[protein-PII] uridylyltransferase
MSNVGDDVMNDWNASLLMGLYRRLRVAIEHGVESVWQRLSDDLRSHQDTVVSLYADRTDTAVASAQSALDEFFRDVPAGHILETAPAALLRQFDVYMASKQTSEPVVLSTPIEEKGATEIIVSAPDVPGALAQITGAISSLGLNILTAQIVTTAGKSTLDIFRVAQSGGAAHALNPGGQRALTDEVRIARLEERLRDVLSGRVPVEELLAKRIREKRLSDREMPVVDAAVRIVPELSDDFTVIEVKAPDRIGLLYEIASTLQAHGVNIHLSKIDALGTQVIDTFFVDAAAGGPLSPEQFSAVVEALEQVVQASRLVPDSATPEQ